MKHFRIHRHYIRENQVKCGDVEKSFRKHSQTEIIKGETSIRIQWRCLSRCVKCNFVWRNKDWKFLRENGKFLVGIFSHLKEISEKKETHLMKIIVVVIFYNKKYLFLLNSYFLYTILIFHWGGGSLRLVWDEKKIFKHFTWNLTCSKYMKFDQFKMSKESSIVRHPSHFIMTSIVMLMKLKIFSWQKEASTEAKKYNEWRKI